MTGGSLLCVEGIAAGYGQLDILKGISLTVDRGEVVTIIGANGAGKTTTLMALSGIVPLRSGRIVFEGREIHRLRSSEIVGLGVVQVPEGRKIFPRMTVRENLEMGAYLREDRSEIRRDIDRVCGLFPLLGQRLGQLGGTLSGGEQQMLALGRALMPRPTVLLLDEPSMGVAPLVVEKIFDALRQLNGEGMTLLVVEQNAHLALQFASRGYVLETGRVLLSDSSANLLRDPRVREAYLGE